MTCQGRGAAATAGASRHVPLLPFQGQRKKTGGKTARSAHKLPRVEPAKGVGVPKTSVPIGSQRGCS